MAGEHGAQGTEESCRLNETIIPDWLRMSRITCKWFEILQFAEEEEIGVREVVFGDVVNGD